ncbi:MAG TPA: cytochrome C [Aromatoleum sp.]|uniref:cytochrome C n=1 Tax=Aromatoleum sp. TaxID=2307007 RepID=UPI002B459FA9|nr:cytochrome C [Aromatoleum sp.]HJV27552.1 cytochrome C [Aromatoleum sp.]
MRSLRALAASLLLGLAASAAHALPSYARQTGSECAACHVGGFGPQLTPYGMKFKIGGYADTDGKDGKVPLSAMMVANWTRTAKDAADGDKIKHFGSNDNAAMQEASLFLAGRLADNLGTFVQATWSGVDRKSALDQADLRYARTLQFGDKESTVGLSLNSNPTLTDPLNTLGQWRFPYTASDFNAGFGPSPLVESLASGVVGANAYVFFDNHLYAEAGLYNTLSKTTLDRINADDPGKFKGVGKYWRLAYLVDRKRDNFSVGLSGFDANLQPDRTDLGTGDKYRDLGIDAAYQFLGNREHIFTVNASYMKEWQTLDYTAGKLGEADKRGGSLDQLRVAASYHYLQTWGLTAGYFDSRGNRDATRNSSSLNGKPNTSGYILQADWTPWGKEGSWGAPWANVRLGLQYTGYERFMGGAHFLDADGNERRARDNNTTMLFMWMSI